MQQATISTQQTLQEIISRLDRLSEEVKLIRDTLSQAEPTYGSEAWWKWSDAKALEDIKKGNYTTIKSKKELDVYFKSLE